MNIESALSPDLSIQLDHIAITRAIFKGRTIAQDWVEKVLSIVSSMQPFLQPAVVCRWFDVENIDEDMVTLVDQDTCREFVLKVGVHADELASAERVLCSVATLGAEFDRTLSSRQQAGEVLEGYLADCTGIYGLLQVSRAIYKEVEGVAADAGWGVGRVLCPGAIEGWSLEEQKGVCALLPIDQAGIALNDFGVLSPAKSVSFIIGIGPGYAARHVDSPCDICTNKGECWCRY